MAGLADIHGARPSHPEGDALCLMDVAAEEMLRLISIDELAHRSRPGVQSGVDLVERGVVRRRVTDQHQRCQFREPLQSLGDLRLAIFAGRMEWGRAGIAQSGHLPLTYLNVTFVEVVQSMPGAHT